MNISSVFRRNQKLIVTIILLSIALLSLVGLLSCKRAKSTVSSNAKRYDFKGKVVSVDKAKKEITVSHEDIKDYMPAMTMPFPLKDEWAFDVLAPGSNVSATLVVDSNSFWLEGIVISTGANDTIASGATENPANSKVGQEMPNFELVNQDGKRINTQTYKGKALLLTFIYTRCPLPEYCTLMSNNFAELNKRFSSIPALRDRTHLLSITIDPSHDTPKVLRSYGGAYTGKYTAEQFELWEFATGTPDEVKRIAEYFGLTYFEEKQQITHSLRTAIISPDGKVYKVFGGNEWKPADVFAEVEKLLGANAK